MKHKYTSTDLTAHQIQACVMAWMKRHGVFTYHDERGYYVSLYDAKPSSRTSFFETEDEALASWAAGRGIPLWNEEAYAAERSGK